MKVFGAMKSVGSWLWRNVRHLPFIVALAVWGLVPAIIMFILLIAPARFITMAGIWGKVALAWSLASLVLFIIMLLGGYHRARASRIIQSIVGLTCTLVLGLPAIVLSTLPLFGSPQEFLQSLNPDGTEVTLEKEPVRSPGAKEGSTLFIVGIDGSTSFVQDEKDPRLLAIYEALDSIFYSSNDQSLAKSLNTRDLISYNAFAGHSRFLVDNAEGVEGRERLRSRLSEALPKNLAKLLPPVRVDVSDSTDLGRRTTDIISFLDKTACAQIRDLDGRFSRAKIILFSDLIQSVAPSGNLSMSDIVKQRADTLDSIRECMRNTTTPVSVTAFYLKPHGGSKEELAGDSMDVGRYFSSNLPSEKWEEINLDEYNAAGWEEKALKCESLYARVVTSVSPLFLKYHSAPDWEALESRLRLPRTKETDRVFFGLEAFGPGSKSIKIRLGKGAPEEFVLGLDGRDRAFASLDRSASEQNPLVLSMESYPAVPGDTHFELLVAVPRQSVLYRIPIVVLPVMPKSTMLIVKSVFTILHLFPLALSIIIGTEAWKARRRRTAASRRAVPGGAVAAPAPTAAVGGGS